MKKIIITIIVIILVAILAMKGKGLLETRKAEINSATLPAIASVSVLTVKPIQGILRNKEAYLAQIISDKSIRLSTKLAGYVQQILVEESQKVKKGELLVSIDNAEILSSIEALKATLMAQRNDFALAKSIYKRNIKLYEVGGLAKEKLDISKVVVESKDAIAQNSVKKIQQLEHQLSYLKIVAPFDGEIDTLLLQEGDLAASGKPILSMSSGVKNLVFSYATHNTSIKKAQAVYENNQEIGYIKSIYTTSKNGLISAEVTLTSLITLPVGSSINIEVLTKEAKGCIVPNDTILHKKEGTFVMKYEKAKFTPLLVTIEMQEANRMLISPCPNAEIAQASEVKLAHLLVYDKVNVLGAKGE